MLKYEFTRRRIRGLAAASLLAGLLLLPSATLAAEAGTALNEGPDAERGLAAMSIEELRALVGDLSQANEDLRAEADSLQQSVDLLARERDQLAASLDRFDALYDPLESDRKLLFELRKTMPDTRPEAEQRLERIRNLALTSDPQGLGRLVDRVEQSAPAFLDWRFGEYATTQEFSAAYVSSGANAFDSNFDELRSAVLRSVANRLDGLLTILDRAR